MKCRIFACVVLSIGLAACRDGPIHSSYRPMLPPLPAHWQENLGAAHWRIEWLDGGAIWRESGIGPGAGPPFLSIMQEWASPALAWPFWPELGLAPGAMRPCGALFPWDADGDELRFGWEAGVEAVFWKEMAQAERQSAAEEGRLPWYFDWPRFRELLKSENVTEAVRQDPWLPDWKSIAARTVQSGFDRRRIVSRSFVELSIPGFGGLWTGSSPFAAPIDAGPEGPLRLRAWDLPDTWVSSEGIMKCSASGWVFIPHSKLSHVMAFLNFVY